MTKFADCPACANRFAKARSDARYCSRACQSRAAAERSNDARRQGAIRNQGSAGNVVALSAIKALTPAVAPPLSKLLDAEWLECWPDLHRCVSGRLNKIKAGESVHREDAIGNDRQPIGHAVFVKRERIGKVRQHGVVFWTSPRCGSVEEAKWAIEARLSGRPEIVTESLALAA